MLAVTTFKWRVPGYRSDFRAEHVNTFYRMWTRWLRIPHEVVCVTDDPTGIDPRVRIVPLWTDHANVPNPSWPGSPSCYRRLKLFSGAMKHVIGQRILACDLDTVLVGDVTPIVSRTEDVVLLRTRQRWFYNGSLLLVTPGARQFVWDSFNPATSPARAHAAGCLGSDQGWISFCLKDKGEAAWMMGPNADGIYSFREDVRKNPRLPQDAKIVTFAGNTDPWSARAQAHEWVRAHYQ